MQLSQDSINFQRAGKSAECRQGMSARYAHSLQFRQTSLHFNELPYYERCNYQTFWRNPLPTRATSRLKQRTKPGPEYSTLKPFLWIFCDGIKPKLSFLGKTPCFWFYDLNAKGSGRLHLFWCRPDTRFASGLIPRDNFTKDFCFVYRCTFEAGDLRLWLSPLPCTWWRFVFSRHFLDLWKITLWQKPCRHLADQGDWWPVHAPGADSDVVSFHRPIEGQTFSGLVSDE